MKDRDLRAVIFDMDGVIIDSEPIYEEALDISFASFDLPVPPRSSYDNYKGRAGNEVFGEIARQHGYRFSANDFRQVSIQAFGNLAQEKIQLFPQALNFLDFIRQKFEKVGLATSAMKPTQKMIFEKFPLDHYFDIVITSDDISKHKPDPEPYLVTAKLLEVAPEKCMVIEDTFHGVDSSKAAGCFTVAIPNTFTKERLDQHRPDLFVQDFNELKSHMDKVLS